jgi:hypothetical protein
MEGWLAKVSGHGTVWQQSTLLLQLLDLLQDDLLLLLGQLSIQLILLGLSPG